MIRVKIDENGTLWIKRKGKLKRQYCPLQSRNVDVYCGDGCPLFSEPIWNDLFITLELCFGKVIKCYATEFKDERPAEDDIQEAIEYYNEWRVK